jgi:isopenicillin N synthase-like dioxygenase
VDPRENRGYVKIGRERAMQSTDTAEIAEPPKKTPHTKETMEIGRDWDETWRNHWPQESDVPGFRQTMTDFFRVCAQGQYIRFMLRLTIIIKTCHEIHSVIMRAIALGLDMEETFFDDKINEQYHNLRLLSYSSMKASQLNSEGGARTAPHSGAFP